MFLYADQANGCFLKTVSDIPLGDVPEADIGALRVLHNEVELVWHCLHLGHLVLSQLHQAVDLLLKAGHAPGAPLQPELEDVVVSPALDDLVASVVTAVVALVRLEEVVGGHLVAADEEALQGPGHCNCQPEYLS